MTVTDRINNEYFEWLYDLVIGTRGSEYVSYRKLLRFLHDTEFIFSIPLDQNRAEYGISLRRRFAITERCYDAVEYIDGPCSVLEMMVALAIQCEEEIMDNTDYGDRTCQWFWDMIINLGLGSMNDRQFDIRYAEDVIERFLNRDYEPDGRGGLFTVKNRPRDLRDVEIWVQLLWHLDDIV